METKIKRGTKPALRGAGPANTFYRKDVIAAISRKTGVPEIDVDLVLKTLPAVIIEAGTMMKTIVMTGLGRISFKKKAALTVRNSMFGRDLTYLPRTKPFFHFSQTIIDSLIEKKSNT